MRNLADAVVVYEQQYKLRYDKKELPVLQILADARYVLSVVKDKVCGLCYLVITPVVSSEYVLSDVKDKVGSE